MTKQRRAKRKAHAKAERTGMSYQSARNSSQPKIDPCCQEFMAKHERGEHVLLLKDLLHFKNLTPEVDVENFLVSAHLYPMAERAVHAVYAHDRTVVAFRVFEDRFEALESEPSSDIVSFQPALASERMPAGLYAHLVEISKRPRISLPEPKPSAETLKWRAISEAFRNAFMSVAFGPGTVEGQQVWVNAQTYADIRKWGPNFLEVETSRDALMVGRQGSIVNAEGAKRTLMTARHVPPGHIVFDDRAPEVIHPRYSTLRPQQNFDWPEWIVLGAVIETLRIVYPPGSGEWSSAYVKPGQYLIVDLSRGYSRDTSEVALVDMETLTRHALTTVAWLDSKSEGQDRARLINKSYTHEVTKHLTPIPIGVNMR